MRGFFGICTINTKTSHNIGTLWRSANIFGAAFLSTVGRRYKKQAADTLNTPAHVPLYEYKSFDELQIPKGTQLIGVEITPDAIPIREFKHPERAIYILGPEDGSIPNEILSKCQAVIKLPGNSCLNLATAGSLVMYDRIVR